MIRSTNLSIPVEDYSRYVRGSFVYRDTFQLPNLTISNQTETFLPSSRQCGYDDFADDAGFDIT